jgi:hypothetical protein
MSTYYYLFSSKSKECINLGKKGRRDDYEYDGPSIFLDGKTYLLPAKYLELMRQRFMERNDKDSVFVCPDYDLFDTEMYLKFDEEFKEIGGDRDFDLPIVEYLPEIEDKNVKIEIMSREELRL